MKDKVRSRTSKIRLAAGRQLRKEPPNGHVLAGPRGVVQLNESAAAILSLCDGTLTRDQIITRILRRSKDDRFAIEVRDFLNAARRRGWIIEESLPDA